MTVITEEDLNEHQKLELETGMKWIDDIEKLFPRKDGRKGSEELHFLVRFLSSQALAQCRLGMEYTLCQTLKIMLEVEMQRMTYDEDTTKARTADYEQPKTE